MPLAGLFAQIENGPTEEGPMAVCCQKTIRFSNPGLLCNYNEIQAPRRKSVLIGYQKLAELTAADGKNQFIVSAEAFGQGQEHDLLGPMISKTRGNHERIGQEKDVFKKTQLTSAFGRFHLRVST